MRSAALKILYGMLSFAGVLRAWSRYGLRDDLAVLTYHGVRPRAYQRLHPLVDGNLVEADEFQAQLRLLKRRYHVVTPEEAREAIRGARKFPARSVLLTCDDGALNNLTDMLPLLQAEGLSALFFVTSVPIARPLAFLWHEMLDLLLMTAGLGPRSLRIPGLREFQLQDDAGARRALLEKLISELSRVPEVEREQAVRALAASLERGDWLQEREQRDASFQRRFRPLSAPELRELVKAGMAVGSHTRSHVRLPDLPDADAAEELASSRREIMQVTGSEVWALAYPFGDPAAAGTREARLAEAAGYECAFVNYGGIARRESGRFTLPRCHIGVGASPASVEATVSGFDFALRRWLG